MLKPCAIANNIVTISEGKVIRLIVLQTPVNCALLFLPMRLISLVSQILIIKMLSFLEE